MDNIVVKMADTQCGEWAIFLPDYLHQMECFLHIIRTCRQGDWEEYLVVGDEEIKYFNYDLYKYAWMMPLHLAQMN